MSETATSAPLPLPILIGEGERLTWDLSPDDRRWRGQRLSGLPRHFAVAVAKKYRKVHEREGRRTANLTLLETTERLNSTAIRLASNEDDIRIFAKRRAQYCSSITSRYTCHEQAIAALSDYAARFGIAAPTLERGITLQGAIKRLCSERWWRRALRRSHGRNLEQSAIELGLVHKRAGIYASDETVKRRQEQRQRNRDLLEAIHAVNEFGQEYTLQELSDLSTANPKLRRAELMTRCAGFEMIAREQGDAAEFYTLTCPSRMHPVSSISGQTNPKYDGTTPSQSVPNKGVGAHSLRLETVRDSHLWLPCCRTTARRHTTLAFPPFRT
jgi:hypothetical protein